MAMDGAAPVPTEAGIERYRAALMDAAVTCPIPSVAAYGAVLGKLTIMIPDIARLHAQTCPGGCPECGRLSDALSLLAAFDLERGVSALRPPGVGPRRSGTEADL